MPGATPTDFRRLLGYLRPYLGLSTAIIGLGLVVSGATGASAYIIRPVMDKVFVDREAGMLAWLPWAVLAIFFVKCTAAYGQSVLTEMLGSRVLMDIRNDFFGALLSLPVGRFTTTASGEYVSRLTNDVALLQRVVGTLVKDLVRNGATVIVLIGVILYQDAFLAIFALGVMPIAYYPLIALSKRLRKRSREGQEAVSILTQVLTGTLGGIREVKGFVAEEREARRFAGANRVYRSTVVRVARVASIPPPMMEFIGALGIVGIIMAGGTRVIDGAITAGAFWSFVAACLMLYSPMRSLALTNANLQQALAAARRVFEVLDMPREGQDGGARVLDGVRESVVFDGVSFAYAGEDGGAVRGVSLTAGVGDVVALVGPSGAGKSTLVNLIPRFLEPAEGVIRIDGVDSREFSLPSLRARIGIVGQDPVLFDATIGENIAYGAGGAEVSAEAIADAAAKAHAHDFISALPNGYDTRVGERGVMLSGGQRQRIAIARAILKDAPILILDEATSALDSESERHVQEALNGLMARRTTFVIAHRLSTVRHATQILVLDGGRVAERGTHDELLALDGLYRKLHDIQLKPAAHGG
ncbi:MAG: ABC transporter ATP-binding protein [Nitrospirae bacterium]|nr:ABC transporter ATP-binding protein [Nitrospirota bacterium]